MSLVQSVEEDEDEGETKVETKVTKACETGAASFAVFSIETLTNQIKKYAVLCIKYVNFGRDVETIR